ncbi:hypothetical protein HBN50_00860 [Halobacteriovorax sp. GB3]|uniref:hypothetical protein n=1 Tax=Halobacteriovorax sp. GB3 TaxID=2719615 RepID=UPI00236278E4|nr:hypothetical protein [Halobacteriovorax sp. GB3]MDD0851616.1 hypothetical protein [Halobacteriovorax sp. GB3]
MKINGGIVKFLILTLFTFTLFGCSDPMNTKITKENYKKVLEGVRKNTDEKTYEKVQAIVKLAEFAKLGGKDPIDFLEGKSFNEHLNYFKHKAEEEQVRLKQEELKALQVAKAAEDKIKERSQYLKTLSWIKKKSKDKYGFNKKVVVGIHMQNMKNKDIDAFEGTIYIYDKLNNQLAKLGVKSTDVIKAGSKSNLTWVFPTIDFSNNMKEVYETSPGSLKFRFEPSKILLKNGTEI